MGKNSISKKEINLTANIHMQGFFFSHSCYIFIARVEKKNSGSVGYTPSVNVVRTCL